MQSDVFCTDFVFRKFVHAVKGSGSGKMVNSHLVDVIKCIENIKFCKLPYINLLPPLRFYTFTTTQFTAIEFFLISLF